MRRFFVLLAVICCATPTWSQQFYIPGFISKRAVINLNFVQNVADYAFINMLQEGRATLSPYSSSYSTGAYYWNSAAVDSAGYPTASCASSCTDTTSAFQPDQFNFTLPSSGNFGSTGNGYYCLQGRGSATLAWPSFPSGASFTLLSASASNPCAKRTGGTINWSQDDCTGASGHGTIPAGGTTNSTPWTITDNGNGWCIAFNVSGIPVATPNLTGEFTTNDPSATGAYINALALYESVDVTDWANGLWYRHAYKAPIVTLDPGAIRFGNWNGMVNSVEMRFENRPTPYNEVGYTGIFGPIVPYLPYTTTTGANQYTVAAVTGTPSSMQHGEVARFRAATSSTLATKHGGSYAQVVISVTVPTSGIVVVETGAGSTPSPHGFNPGDTITFVGLVATNTKNFNYFYASNIGYEDGTYCGASDTGCFYFSFTTTTICPSGSCTLCNSQTTCGLSGCTTTNDNCAVAEEGLELEVGTGNDRTSYPILNQNGAFNYSYYFSLTAGSYYKFCFNKNALQNDGAGNFTYGAWIDCTEQTAADTPVPLELQTELINELNALGPSYPINMWVNIPHMALLPSDPNYTTASDYPANMLKVIFQGANGFTGLTSGCPQCLVLTEGANETWNTAVNDGPWLAYLGSLPANNPHTGCGEAITNDEDTYSTLWAELVAQDIRQSGNAPPTNTKYLLGGHGNFGTLSGTNYNRITGHSLSLSGCWPAAPTGAGAPMGYFDYFNVASYINVTNSFASANLVTGTCPSPSSGSQGSVGCAGQWAYDAATGGMNSAAALNDIQSWVTNGLVTSSSTCSSASGCSADNSIYAYQTYWEPCLAELLSTGGFTTPSRTTCGAPLYSIPSFAGKFLINYEGGLGTTLNAGLGLNSYSCTSGTVTVSASQVESFITGDYIYIYSAVPSAYNGVWQLTATPTSTTFQFSIASCPIGTVTSAGFATEAVATNADNNVAGNGFLTAVQQSQVWATAEVNFFNTVTALPYSGFPAIYTFNAEIFAQNNGSPTWTASYPDAYGATTIEGNGYYPVWYLLGTYDAQYPYLLQRDLHRGAPANDNDDLPAFMNSEAA